MYEIDCTEKNTIQSDLVRFLTDFLVSAIIPVIRDRIIGSI